MRALERLAGFAQPDTRVERPSLVGLAHQLDVLTPLVTKRGEFLTRSGTPKHYLLKA